VVAFDGVDAPAGAVGDVVGEVGCDNDALGLAAGDTALGMEWMSALEPCVSWLSVSAAKRAWACAARTFMGSGLMRRSSGGEAGEGSGAFIHG
jgi:hypothetical protein